MRTFIPLLLGTAIATASAQSTPPPADLPLLDALGRAPSAANIERDVRTLVGFGTRHTLSDTTSPTRGIGAARRWVFDEFTRISKACGGCLEVRYVSGTVQGEPRIPGPVEVVSVIAIQRGTVDPNRYVIMSGDIDSRASDVMDATSDAPGANDNASGLAGVLEAARVLSRQRFAGSIVYAALSGEEQGLYGGKFLAEEAKRQGWRIEAVLNNDMIGNIAGIDGVIDNHTARVFSEGTRATETAEEARQRRFTGGELDSPSRNLARYIARMAEHVPNLDVMLVNRLDRFGRGGHHRPFNEAGYPAVRVMEAHEHYDRQHQDVRTENGRRYGDTIDGVDFPYAAKLTALNVVALAGLASAPPPPADVRIEGAVSADTTLKWTRPPAAQAATLAGYRVYWRLTTDPQWTHGRWVGDVTTATLHDVVIDDYFFGVAAVAKDGSESPVVFPGAAGSFGGY
ncbi:M28 family metallopeptidase [Thermomonas haemolytica]|uniref:Peptidase M28-like protein n=1 Tax=Thermomonas haemolytica TaxID=141949 RepID=A0A4R3N176_9GAMM|nr:M28 family metallopeptidase [Thermomonas haemolytica]TCT21811.1 peptidase M28-like protein [Thermomonas haemolytica]TNY28269.1 peptidase M28 [Thermomonas haemolytica]